jgi:hypothetical protein
MKLTVSYANQSLLAVDLPTKPPKPPVSRPATTTHETSVQVDKKWYTVRLTVTAA